MKRVPARTCHWCIGAGSRRRGMQAGLGAGEEPIVTGLYGGRNVVVPGRIARRSCPQDRETVDVLVLPWSVAMPSVV